MADKLSPVRRSANMRAIRSKDTSPELRIRRLLYAMGYRYRLHQRHLPGKPDIAFIGRRKVIFIHGCFWHQHHGCREGRPPKSNLGYWLPKLDRNVARDRENLERLQSSGWQALTIWECDLEDESALRRSLSLFLGPPARELAKPA